MDTLFFQKGTVIHKIIEKATVEMVEGRRHDPFYFFKEKKPD
jgi:hypothetical protein